MYESCLKDYDIENDDCDFFSFFDSHLISDSVEKVIDSLMNFSYQNNYSNYMKMVKIQA